MKGTSVVVAIVLACGSTPAAAQSSHPAALAMSGLFPVYVLDRSGEETKGRLVSLTGSAVVLQMDNTTRTFDLADVVRIDRQGDSLKNGAIIGAVVGAAMGIFTGGFADCPDARARCPGSRVALTLVSTGVWSAIGVGIDALIPGRTLLWKRSAQTARQDSASSGLTLHVSPRLRSASVSWKFRP